MTDKTGFSDSGCYVFGFTLDGKGGGKPVIDLETVDQPQWLHIDYSEKGATQWLRALGIPDNVVDSLVRLDTRPRAMAVGDGILVNLRAVNTNPGDSPDDMVSIRFWLEQNRLISVRQRKVLAAQDIKAELEAGKGPSNAQELITLFIENIADRIADYVDLLEEKISAHESSIEKADANRARTDVSALRREAAVVRRYLAPQRDALDAFYRQSRNILGEQHNYFVHEQSDRIVRYVEDLDLVRERALVLQEELMNRIAQEQNARMYVLSIIAAIFLPISFITGLFGMNVAGLPGVEQPGAFLLVGGLMVLMVVGTLGYFRLKKWL